MDLRETGWEGLNRMHLAQDRGQYQALLYMVMDLLVESFFTRRSTEGLCSVELVLTS